MKRGQLVAMTVAALGLGVPAGAAQVSVGSGASFDLGTGSADLGCADLTVAGTLSAGTVGLTAARDVTIDPTGLVNGNSATLEVAGDWGNAGTFNAGTSTVQLVDGCDLASAVVSGDTTFANLDVATTTGFLYSFTAGSTQTVAGSLALTGSSGNLLTIRSTLDGAQAFLDLDQASTGSFVDVKDNHAIGQPVTLDENSVISGNAVGWGLAPVIPVLSLLGLGVLGAWLYVTGHRNRRRRARANP